MRVRACFYFPHFGSLHKFKNVKFSLLLILISSLPTNYSPTTYFTLAFNTNIFLRAPGHRD